MKVGIIGCGNVGYSTLNAFLEYEIDVIAYDINEQVRNKIESDFSSDVKADKLIDLVSCDIVFECVPTDPKLGSLECDLSILEQLVSEFSGYESLDEYQCRVFVQRSTCPPGTADKLTKEFSKTLYAVNPSFLTKATMLDDSLYPKRLMFGGDSDAIKLLKLLYTPFTCESIFESNCLKTVELFKYIENCTDSVLISLWNEYLRISDSLNISREQFFEIMENFTKRERFSSALRIPSKAFGLWCLPKDISALVHQANDNNIQTHVLDGAIKTNLDVSDLFGINDIPTEELLKYEGTRLKPTDKAKDQILVSKEYKATL